MVKPTVWVTESCFSATGILQCEMRNVILNLALLVISTYSTMPKQSMVECWTAIVWSTMLPLNPRNTLFENKPVCPFSFQQCSTGLLGHARNNEKRLWLKISAQNLHCIVLSELSDGEDHTEFGAFTTKIIIKWFWCRFPKFYETALPLKHSPMSKLLANYM